MPKPTVQTDIRTQILQATLELAIEHGWEGVKIRKISQVIGYSAPIIYRQFENKAAIIQGLFDYALDELIAEQERLAPTDMPPRKRLLGMAEGFWTFGFANPKLYELLFALDKPFGWMDTEHLGRREMFVQGIELMLSVNPDLDWDEAHDYLANFFSLVHGYVHLALGQRLYTEEGGAGDAYKSMIRAVERLVKQI
ncbi:MAG: TetR/AcrR family transcriptional regulator [Bacteroidota bacterium]